MHLLAALSWDPQLRGVLIVVTAFLILPGSVYMLLMTNVGARVGFLLAAAALTGWLTVMGIVWAAYGIGIKGKAPHWNALEVVTGNLTKQTTLEQVEHFPTGWKKLQAGNATLADAQSSADKVLVGSGGSEAGHGGGGEPANTGEEFAPVFGAQTEYLQVAGYEKGGEDYWIPGGLLEVSKGPFQGWLHKPHYAVIQVQPVLKEPNLGGAPSKPVADPTKPVTSVIMIRDLGALRKNSILVSISMGIVFTIICNALHRRDKEIQAARGTGATAKAG